MGQEFNLLYWNTNYKEKQANGIRLIEKYIVEQISKVEEIEKYKDVDAVIFSEGFPQINNNIKQQMMSYYSTKLIDGETTIWKETDISSIYEDDYIDINKNKLISKFKSNEKTQLKLFPYCEYVDKFDINFPYMKDEKYMKIKGKNTRWSFNPNIIIVNDDFILNTNDSNNLMTVVENKQKKIRLIGIRIGMLGHDNDDIYHCLVELNWLYYKKLLYYGCNDYYTNYDVCEVDDAIQNLFKGKKVFNNILNDGKNYADYKKNILSFVNILEKIYFNDEYISICSLLKNINKEIYDYLIRRVQYNYIMKYIESLNDDWKTIVVGDFNISNFMNKGNIWNYENVIEKNVRSDKSGFQICENNTIGNNKVDYLFLKNCVCKKFDVVNECEIKKGKGSFGFPDHNLLFASIDLGD